MGLKDRLRTLERRAGHLLHQPPSLPGIVTAQRCGDVYRLSWKDGPREFASEEELDAFLDEQEFDGIIVWLTGEAEEGLAI